MTSQQDQIQSLIADIDQALGAPKPQKPWIKASEVEPQRRALNKVQDYLKSLQQTLDAPDGWGPVDPNTGQIASQQIASQNSPRPRVELFPTSGESAENLLQGLLTEMSFLKSSALEPLRLEMNSLQAERDRLQQEVQALAEQREAAAAQYRSELEAALEANRQASQRQEEIVRQEAIARRALSARQEAIARQEESAQQAALARQQAIAQQEESAQQAALARQQAIAQQEESARQAVLARQAELAEQEEANRQAAIARQQAIAQQEESAQQAALARQAELTQREESARQAALARQQAITQLEELARRADLARQAELAQREESAQQAALTRQQAIAQQEENAQQAALARLEEITQQEERAQQEAIARREALTQQEEAAQQAALIRQEELAQQEESAQQAALARQEELTRQQEELTRQEESAQQAALARQEELTRQQEELTRQEEIAQQAALIRQEELARQQEELTRQEEIAQQAALARQEELAQQQEELARQQEELARQEEVTQQAALARQEELTRQQEELAQQEEIAQQAALARQEELDRQQEELARQQEELARQQEELARQEEIAQQAALARQSELAQQEEIAQQAALARQEDLTRQQEELARQEESAQQAAALARQEELTRQEASAEIAEQQLNQFLAALMERLQENLSAQVTRTLEQLKADHTEAINLLTAAETERIQLDTNGQIEELQQLQNQSDQLLVNIDSTLQRMFETLQRNIDSYQTSLNDGVENMHSLGRQGEGIVRSLVDHLTEQLEQAASVQPAFSPPAQSQISPAEAPLAPETVTSLNDIFPEDAEDAEDETEEIASETDELRPEDCIQPDGTIDLDLLRLDIDRSDEADELTLTDLSVEPMVVEESAIAAQSTNGEGTQVMPTDDATYLANLTLDDLTLDQSLADLDLADDLALAEASDPALDTDLDLESDSARLEQPASNIPDQQADLQILADQSPDDQTPDLPPEVLTEEETELAAVLPDFGSAYDSADNFDVAMPTVEPAIVTAFGEADEEAEPEEVGEEEAGEEEPENTADLPDEQPESAVVPDIPDADDDTELLDRQTDVPSDDLVAVLAAVSRDSEQIAVAEADSDLTALTSDLEEATVSEAADPMPVTLSQETQPLESAMIPDEPEAELENAPETQWESDPQSEIEVELEAGFQNGIEVELEDRPESEFEFGLENELQDGIEAELETPTDSEPELDLENELEFGLGNEPQNELEIAPESFSENELTADLENELEFGLGNEPQNELEIAPENTLEDVFEGDDEVELESTSDSGLENLPDSALEAEDETESAAYSQPDSLFAETLPVSESLSDDDDDWAALEEILDEPPESSLDSGLIELSGSVETVSPHPEIFDDDLDFYSAVSAGTDLEDNSRETPAAWALDGAGDGDNDDDTLANQPTEWFLGIDLGTTGISAVLINQLGSQVYPLCWNMAGDDQGDRLRLPAIAQVVDGENGHLSTVGPAALQQEAPLLRHIKPLVKIGIPHEVSGEPLIQWSDQVALPLLTVQTALIDLLKTLSVDALSCYAGMLKEGTLRTALSELKGVIVGYPNNWPDTYSFNVREAVLAAGLVIRPDQVFFVEEAIAALLSVLPDPQFDSELIDDQQPGLYNCNWSGGTVVISAGASLTEVAIAKLPTELDQLSYRDFTLRSFAYAGDSIDQDIVCQLLHLSVQDKAAADTDTGEADEADTWQSLGLHRLNLPQAGEVDRIKRHRLRQRLNNSALGRQVLAAARQIKLTLQEEEQFDLSLAGRSWTIHSKDLESKIFIPYVQRINRQVSGLLSQTGLSDQAVKQVICTGGSASLRAIAGWLGQKFPNAMIIQDTYSGEYSNGGSRVAYGLANLCHYPNVLDTNRHQYNDYYLLAELLRILPDQPLPAGGILHLLAQRGIDTQLCQSHILALIEGHLPPGLVPAESDRPLISARSSETATYQMLAELPLFRKQGGQIYIADPQQGVRLRTHLESLLAAKAQSLAAPLTVEMAAESV